MLATYRMTKLIIDDEITSDLRDAVINRLDKLKSEGKISDWLAYKVEYLIGCPWCVSVWVGLAVFTLRKTDPDLADLVNGMLAASAVTGIIKENEYRIIPG